jgi:acyl transferase domain-containing protein/NADPH:quinone reductase-like Zn-dependent oxidoreductase/acyl carrier protein
MAGEAGPISADKQTLLALRALRQRVEELEGMEREPIAIIGMACRFPGGSDTPEDFWKLLQEKRDAVGEIPRERLDLELLFDPKPQTAGKTYCRWAGLHDSPGSFDADFFGISPREAVSMDPQHRMLLETSWEALENAGIAPKTLAGEQTGVFVGITTSEYAQLQQRITAREKLTAYVLQGSALNAAAGRLSYFYGSNGPSMTIDTACSSSLVAIDRACKSLQQRETSLAIAAGVNLMAVPDTFVIASQWGVLSPTGKIRAFDALADGFVRGEGCGVLLLKRRSEALRDGDRVLGWILSSAMNQDGASSGLTVPNGLAQQSLLREAHRRAGIEARQVGYVEAHGTGTSLGDPIEAEALGSVFAGRERKLAIGSVKTNVGHLESAAGVAGLIKVVLGMQHGEIPAQLHWERPSEHVRWNELPLEVVTETRKWEAIDGRRIAGVSSFGFSGTNAHVVLESSAEPESLEEEGREEVLVLSARTAGSLRSQAERYADHLEKTQSRWEDICFTAAVGRSVFGERLAVVASSREAAAEKLRLWLESGEASGVHRGQVSASERSRGGSGLSTSAPCAEVAEGFVRGAVVDWRERAGGRVLRRVALPTYAFERERYWVEATAELEAGEPSGGAMLGRRLRSAGVRAQYETRLEAESWVGEHVVNGRVVLPATGHVELMLEAAAELGVGMPGAGTVVEDVVLASPLVVEGMRRVQVVVEEEQGGRSRVRVYAEKAASEKAASEKTGGGWERCSEGWLRASAAASSDVEDLAAVRERLTERVGSDDLYPALEARGLRFGERFRGVERVWTGQGEALGEIAEREQAGAGWQLAPWWLDACLQVAGVAAEEQMAGELYLPMSVEQLQLHARPQGTVWSHVRMERIDNDTLQANLSICNQQGNILLHIQHIRFRKIKKQAEVGLYSVNWVEVLVGAVAARLQGNWIVIDGDAHRHGLERRGMVCSTLNLSGATDVSAIRRLLRDEVLKKGRIEGVLDLRSSKAIGFASLGDWASEIGTPNTADAMTLLQALLLEQISPAQGVWFISRNVYIDAGEISVEGQALQAMRRTVALEFPELKTRFVSLEGEAGSGVLIRALETGEVEIRASGDRLLVPRLKERKEATSSQNMDLMPGDSGLIEDLRAVDVGRTAPLDDEVEIAVEAHGLNFRDVMNALGMLPGMSQRLGGECAGIVQRAGKDSGFAAGDRVFSFAVGSFRDFVTVKAANVARTPEGFTSREAAALPIAYLTAFYGFDRLAGIQEGETVLIHSAAGGLGLAAVNVARARGATVIATAGSEQKRDYLRTLGIKDVLPSRTADFGDEVMRITEGRGVDVVLNSLTGTLAERTLEVLARGGRFLEVGKRDTLTKEEVRHRRSDVQHFIYDLGQQAEKDGVLVPELLREMLVLLERKKIMPLPVTEFSEAREAFKFMAQARHIGKIVIRGRETPKRSFAVKAGATYIVTGGFGGLGLLFAESLVKDGADHIVLAGRREPDMRAQEAIGKMRSRGVEVTVARVDVADAGELSVLLGRIPAVAPLKGILHCAGVLDDHSFLEQTVQGLSDVMRPKALGAWNLHCATRDLPLDFFVLFSSAAALFGSAGQANYAAANGVLDALAEYRCSLGLPACSMQWGPWKSRGMAEKIKTDLDERGLREIDADAGYEAMKMSVESGEACVAAVAVSSWARVARHRSSDANQLLEGLIEVSSTAVEKKPGFVAQIMSVPDADRREFLCGYLRERSVEILSLAPGTQIDQDEALHDLGLDSLMAVELRNALAASLERQLSPTLVLDYPTLRTLTDYLLSLLNEVAADGRVEKPDAGIARDIRAISDEEAEALLLQELGRQEYGTRR